MSKCPLCKKGNLHDYMLKPISKEYLNLDIKLELIEQDLIRLTKTKPIDKNRLNTLRFEKEITLDRINKIPNKDYRVCLSCFNLIKKYGKEETMKILSISERHINKKRNWSR